MNELKNVLGTLLDGAPPPATRAEMLDRVHTARRRRRTRRIVASGGAAATLAAVLVVVGPAYLWSAPPSGVNAPAATPSVSPAPVPSAPVLDEGAGQRFLTLLGSVVPARFAMPTATSAPASAPETASVEVSPGLTVQLVEKRPHGVRVRTDVYDGRYGGEVELIVEFGVAPPGGDVCAGTPSGATCEEVPLTGAQRARRLHRGAESEVTRWTGSGVVTLRQSDRARSPESEPLPHPVWSTDDLVRTTHQIAGAPEFRDLANPSPSLPGPTR